MVSSSESNGVLGEALNQLLGETFGTSGSGRINIKALHQLLSSLIDLHIRYEEEKQQQKNILNSVPLQTTSTASEAVACVNKLPDGDKITQLPTEEESSKSVDKIAEDSSNANDKQPSSSVPNLSGSPKNEKGNTSTSIQAAEENGNDKTLIINASSLEQESPETIQSSTLQRSSDFLTKSTSSSEKSNDLLNQTRSSASRTPSSGGKSSPASVGKKLTKGLEVEKEPAKDSTTQTSNEFEAILEGCRNHLEAVKEEVLSLKARCQSQHDDMLKLAGGLDSVVYRIETQQPKVEKLETDTHCLGMLVSDYEVNFQRIEKHLERHDVKVQEFERTFQRIDKERDALRADIRSINEQANYLATVKADKVDVQTELNRRALVTDMQQRVPYPVFNDTARDVTRSVTQLREELHDVDQHLKTIQYELVKGLGAKASAQDVTLIRKQLTVALSRWQKVEKDQQARTVIMGDSSSAAVTANCETGTSSDVNKCLTCGIQTTLEGNHTVVPTKFIPVNRIKHGARNAGGIHTKCIPPEKVFRTGSLGVVKKTMPDQKSADHHWKM
uniref:DUF4795 domain-containing protein n=1 Tax=Anopheles funestus TaxID=62324 RepID=A0A182RCR9_ANOFN